MMKCFGPIHKIVLIQVLRYEALIQSDQYNMCIVIHISKHTCNTTIYRCPTQQYIYDKLLATNSWHQKPLNFVQEYSDNKFILM